MTVRTAIQIGALLFTLGLPVAVQGQDCSKFVPPPKYLEGTFGDIIFCLDASRAWAVLNDLDRDFPSLAVTKNGGRTWVVRRLEQQEYVPVSIFFLDKKHGWLTLSWALGHADSAHYKLLRTSDGGAAWAELPSPPGSRELTFTSMSSGCLITDTDSNSHWVTRDGGRTWRELVGEGCK